MLRQLRNSVPLNDPLAVCKSFLHEKKCWHKAGTAKVKQSCWQQSCLRKLRQIRRTCRQVKQLQYRDGYQYGTDPWSSNVRLQRWWCCWKCCNLAPRVQPQFGISPWWHCRALSSTEIKMAAAFYSNNTDNCHWNTNAKKAVTCKHNFKGRDPMQEISLTRMPC